MAILQSRMLALINAALTYQKAYRSLCQMIHNERKNITEGRQTGDGALYNLEIEANESLIENIAAAQHSISAEHYHFEKNLRKNEWNRQYQAQKRGHPPTRQFYEPQHAANAQLSPINIAFRAEGQNRRGDMKGTLDYTPRELSPEAKWEIENRPPQDMTPEQEAEYQEFLKRRAESDAHEIPKGQDPFKGTLNSEYDPNFDLDEDRTE